MLTGGCVAGLLYLIPEDAARWKYRDRQSAGGRTVVARNWRKLRRIFGRALLASGSLSQRAWDHAHGE